MRTQRPGHWLWIDHAKFDAAAQLGSVALAVYCALCRLESKTRGAKEKERFEATKDEIAEAAGCSRATVTRTILTLESANLISVKGGGNLRQKTNRYTIRCGSERAAQAAHCEPLGRLTLIHDEAQSEPALTIQITESISSAPQQGGALANTAQTENAAHSAPPLGEGAEAAPETEKERVRREWREMIKSLGI